VAPAATATVAGPYGPAPKINGLDLILGPPVAMLRDGAESFSLLVRVDDKPSGTLLSSFHRVESEDSYILQQSQQQENERDTFH
jgi:hypothetical protein